jgi:hypothetical protein
VGVIFWPCLTCWFLLNHYYYRESLKERTQVLLLKDFFCNSIFKLGSVYKSVKKLCTYTLKPFVVVTDSEEENYVAKSL